MSEFVGVCMDAWEALGEKKQPREFVQAANRIRKHESRKPTGEKTPELEDLPWAKR
jgi:hypothetical protein